jgi:hypothetical protein
MITPLLPCRGWGTLFHGPALPGVPASVFDALLRLGYNREVPIYCHRLSMAHGLDVCEVSVTIPFDPKE